MLNCRFCDAPGKEVYSISECRLYTKCSLCTAKFIHSKDKITGNGNEVIINGTTVDYRNGWYKIKPQNQVTIE